MPFKDDTAKRAYQRDWARRNRLANPQTEEQKISACNRARLWYAANPEKTKANSRKWAEANPDKANEQSIAKNRRWKKNNPHKVNACVSRRRAAKLQATPMWADEFIISEIYELAQLRGRVTGVTHHADHIVPLKSKLVCGLHCEHNLQVIAGVENIKKGNRHWPDMPGEI